MHTTDIVSQPASAGAHGMSGYLFPIDEQEIEKAVLPRPGNLRVAPCSNHFGKVRQPLFKGNAEFPKHLFPIPSS